MAVTVGGLWPTALTARLGAYQDGSGNLWIITLTNNGGGNLTAYKSSDGGATWGTSYATSSQNAGGALDCVFDSINGIIYAVTQNTTSHLGLIYQFTIGTTTWGNFVTGGTAPTFGSDVNGQFPGFLTMRSAGEFVVFYQGPTHANMGSPFRSVYYARCSSAGVWSAGVEVDAGGGVDYDCKSAVLGASDRSHLIFTDSNNIIHRSLSSANVLDTAGNVAVIGGSTYYQSAYYDATLAKVVVGTAGTVADSVYRATSGGANPQTWAVDTNDVGTVGVAQSPVAFVYEPTGTKLYAFFRDGTSLDVYWNATDSTTWTTADAAVQDVATAVAGISLGLIPAPLASPVPTTDGSVGTSAARQQAQSFSVTENGTLWKITVWLQTQAAPTDNVIVEVQTDSAGTPSGTVVGSSGSQAASGLTGTLAPIDFSPAASLTAGTTYWIVARRSGSLDNTNYYRIGTAAGSGEFLYNGTSWSSVGGSRISWVLTPTPTSIGVVYNDNGTVMFDTLSLVTSTDVLIPVSVSAQFLG